MFSPWWHLIVFPLSICFAVMLATRYVSLAVLVTAAVGAVGALLLISQGANIPHVYAVYAILVTVIIFFRHRENIQRLLEGRERRLGDPV